jgi:aryl-alcohol dehydrogenase-like predicted oxidoreductase
LADGRIRSNIPKHVSPGVVRALTPAEARRSLENSLRALRTDHIDILLLHEYEPAHSRDDAIIAFLDESVKTGRIARFGLGSNYQRTLSTLRCALELCGIIQFDSSALVPNIQMVRHLASASLCITHSALGDSLRRVAEFLVHNQNMTRALLSELDINALDEGALPRLMLATALAHNSRGIVLFSSRTADRVINNARAASGEFDTERVRRFETFIAYNRDNICRQSTSASLLCHQDKSQN